MRDLQEAFLTPVARGEYGPPFLWRPGVNPVEVYRRTSVFAKLVLLRIFALAFFSICLACSILATFLLNNSRVIAISLYVMAFALGALLFSHKRHYSVAVLEIRRRWLQSVKATDLYRSHGNLEIDLVEALESIQRSRAVATGIVGHERVTELHKHTWTLLTSQGVTQDDVDALQQAATEITKIDQVLAEQESKTNYDHAREAGKALQDHGQAMTDELRLFRKFLKNERDE